MSEYRELGQEERDGLTVFGLSVNAQIRRDSSGDYLVLVAKDEAELDVDGALLLRGEDIEMLTALVAEAEARWRR